MATVNADVARMKTVIDRTVARYTSIAKKDFYFLVTAAVSSKAALEPTITGFRAFTSCLPGAKEKAHRVWHGRMGNWRHPDKPRHETSL
jgi:hypothetical protein